MREHHAILDDVAGAILDGTPVDWERIEPSISETDPKLIAQLRTLATLRTAAGMFGSSDAGQREYWGHLRVLERVGRGASAEVYRAWDTRLDREVALKLLPAASQGTDSRPASIIDEGRVLARVRHPNVVTIYGAERVDGRIGLWMEFVNGSTVEELVRQGKVFSAREATEHAHEICKAVSAVHSVGLLHRDIKAQNVMVTKEGRVVLMDFGTGLELTDGSHRIAGTPLYLAPEVLSGEIATIQSDIYSIGVLLYRVLARTYPVQGRDLADLRRAHSAGERTLLRTARRDIPSRLSRIIERAIDPNPVARYESADAMAADLAALNKPARVVRLAYAAAAVAAAAAVLWVGWELRGRFTSNASSSPTQIAAGLVGVAAEPPIIAVLPFRNLSDEADTDDFVDGLTNEIIRNLGLVEGLKVKAPTSSFYFRNTRDLANIRKQLGANLLVEGTVQRAGTRLTVDVQLVRIAGDSPIWSKRFDGPAEEIFTIQDEISRTIISKLRLALRSGTRRFETSLQAYQLYLRARTLIEKRGLGDAEEALRLLEQVIASDPSFAPAHAGLADAYANLSNSFDGLDLNKALARMRPAADKALELDPLLPEAHAAKGMIQSRRRKWADAEGSFEKAIALNPSLSGVYTNYVYSTLVPLGKSAYAEQLLETALQADPLALVIRRQLAMVQFVGGRYEEALANIERVLAADPKFPSMDQLKARTLTMAGRLHEALPIWDSKKEIGQEHWAARAYVQAGRRAEVEQMALRQAQPFQEAVIYAALGDKDRTFDALNRGVDAWPHRITVILVSPEMAFLRGDDRLDALRKRLGLP